jgi:MATE family multidrug resistance protein
MGRWRKELREVLTLGVPMGLTQLVQFSIHTIDVVMIGRLGPEPLAAASLGLVILYAIFLFGFGPAMAVSPMVSHALGADPDAVDDARGSVRMALWTIFPGIAALSMLFFFTTEIATALGQPANPAKMAEPYVLAMAPGLSFMVATMALRNFLAVIGHTRAPLLLIVVATALNAFLNWLLIYGNWGFPRLELVGAGIASSLANLAGFALVVLYIRLEPSSRRFHLFKGFWTASWERLREVVQLGWPISVTATFEAMLFNAAVFLMGRIGVDEMAAYQVALNVAALAFMMPLGLSMAGAVRVGLMQGKGDIQGVRIASAVSILACIGAIMIVAVPVMLEPRWVGSLYLDAADPGSAVLLDLVASFLPVAAAFALFDAIQVAANQALRGLKDVRVPMAMTAVAYWVIGFPVAAWLGLRTSVGAIGVWWGLLIALAVAAVLLGLRLFTLTRGPSTAELARAPL